MRQRHRLYLKQHHKIRYYNLLTSGTLSKHLEEANRQAEQMFQSLVILFAKQKNVMKKLKADNLMEWVRKMNNIRNKAAEIANYEVIFV